MLYIKGLGINIVYINNIVFTFLIKRSRMVEAIIIELKKYYNLTGSEDL